MKAIVLAGGEGTRLRPVSANCPKPMVRLIDKPVLQHILELLKKNKITDVCFTLKYLPQVILDYFGDGSQFGMQISHNIESRALGTAGGVKACADFIDGEDFLVISGDAVCDFDLSACIAFHREKNADVTVVLYAHPQPLEYGVVLTDSDLRIQRFIEKPPWDQVFTNMVNTGIYIVSSRVLSEIPDDEPFDFARDLFPRLMTQNRGLYGYTAEGYWCDIGSGDAFLQCAMDALSGSPAIDMGTPVGDKLWSGSPLPEDVTVIPPCYIGKNAVLEKGAQLGPEAIIGAGSHIGSGARVQRSIVDGAFVGEDSVLYGAILCKGSAVHDHVQISEGCIVGENAVIGAGTLITPGIKIWPDKEVPPGTRLSENLVTGFLRGGLRFEENGKLSGEFSLRLGPENCLALGLAAASLGDRIGIGFFGGEGARAAALAFECGVLSAGSSVCIFDASFSAAAAFAGYDLALPATVFICQKGGLLELSFFGENGGLFPREAERKIESAVSGGNFTRVSASKTGCSNTISGIVTSYTAAAVRQAQFIVPAPVNLQVAVSGRGTRSRTLKQVLSKLGVRISGELPGCALLTVSEGGFMLSAVDEKGNHLDWDQLQVILAFLEFEHGSGRIAAPYTAPAALDLLASSYSSTVLRLSKEGRKAAELYARQPFMRDGIFAAARLCAGLSLREESLYALSQRVPKFSTVTRTLPIVRNRGTVMRELVKNCAEMSTELFEGLRVNTGRGFVHVSPDGVRSALRISSEAKDMEAAEALCLEFERLTRKIDSAE